MSIVVYGSLPSPYVRRVRMLLEGVDYQLELLNVYDDATRAEYSKITPIRKLPLLVDEGQPVFDSHVIYHHLCRKLDRPECSLEQHNLVSVIDAATDSLIILFLSSNSGLTLDADKPLFKLQMERIPNALSWLDQQARRGEFDEWHYASLSLVSLIDWANFRELYDFSDFPDLMAAKNKHNDRSIVLETMPQ
jgi:glutathione S-transferase